MRKEDISTLEKKTGGGGLLVAYKMYTSPPAAGEVELVAFPAYISPPIRVDMFLKVIIIFEILRYK